MHFTLEIKEQSPKFKQKSPPPHDTRFMKLENSQKTEFRPFK